jgi:hypothetical protein
VLLGSLSATVVRAAPADTFYVYLPVVTKALILPPGVAVLAAPVARVDTLGDLHVLGEVGNNSGTAVDFVKVTANLFNASHQLVATESSFTDPTLLSPSDYACFDVLFLTPPTYATLELEAPSYQTPFETYSPGLTVLSPSGSVDGIGFYHIIGQVQNNGGATSHFVQPVGTLYDNSGNVLDCESTYVSSTDLTPGQTSAFDIQFVFWPPYADVASWRVTVHGQP